MGTWKKTDDMLESPLWRNIPCIHPVSPKPLFCAPVWWLMDQHFPSNREGHPLQLPWQCRPLPCQLREKKILLLLFLYYNGKSHLRTPLLGCVPPLLALFAVCILKHSPVPIQGHSLPGADSAPVGASRSRTWVRRGNNLFNLFIHDANYNPERALLL